MIEFYSRGRISRLSPICLGLLGVLCIAFASCNAQGSPAGYDRVEADSSRPSYSWRKLQPGTKVGIKQARFDRDGYELETETGVRILAPFEDRNMYVMAFGRSQTEGAYVVIIGASPVLYLPTGGHLVNAEEPTALWYPLSPNAAYANPVLVAPSETRSGYESIVWYPGMTYEGGPYILGIGGAARLMPGSYISIGNESFPGFVGYRTYVAAHSVIYPVVKSARGPETGREVGDAGDGSVSGGAASASNGALGSIGGGSNGTFGGTGGSATGNLGGAGSGAIAGLGGVGGSAINNTGALGSSGAINLGGGGNINLPSNPIPGRGVIRTSYPFPGTPPRSGSVARPRGPYPHNPQPIRPKGPRAK